MRLKQKLFWKIINGFIWLSEINWMMLCSLIKRFYMDWTYNSWMILDSCRKTDHKTSELSNTIDRIYTCENDNLKLNQLLNKCNEISYGY